MGEENYAVSIFQAKAHSHTATGMVRVKCLLRVHQGLYQRQKRNCPHGSFLYWLRTEPEFYVRNKESGGKWSGFETFESRNIFERAHLVVIKL